MKQTITLLLCFLFSDSVYSSHLMGGQITARPISGRTYQVTMTLYRDTYGIPMGPSETINYENADSLTPWTALSSILSVTTPFINATEEYEYIDTVTFPRNGTFTIYYHSCCRNAAILNGPGGANSFYLHTTVEVDSANPNSTPVFLNKPITLASINNLWTYNPLPFDADGDSLAWHLAIPLENPNLACPYVPPFANSAQPFTLDSITGQITWIPNTLGNFVSSFLVEEFRNGVKIGEIRRDMQVIVINTSGARMTVSTGGWPVNTDGHYEFDLSSSSSFTLPVIASDMDFSGLNLAVSGEPFLLATNPAQCSIVSSGAGTASLQIDWTPLGVQQRNEPYIVTIRTFENNGAYTLCKDLTFLLRVSAPTGLTEPNSLPVSCVYPNPVNEELSVPVSLDTPSRLELTIYNSMGQVATTQRESILGTGSHVIKMDHLDLSPGMYFLKISDGQHENVQRFVVTSH